MTDGVIDVDMAGSGARAFYNILFRTQGDGNGEQVYLRPHKTGLDDAQQHTPTLNGAAAWQIYNGPGFTRAVDIPRDAWFHVHFEFTRVNTTPTILRKEIEDLHQLAAFKCPV